MWVWASLPRASAISCQMKFGFGFRVLALIGSASHSHGRDARAPSQTLRRCGMVVFAKGLGQRARHYWRCKHHTGKQQVALYRVAEERQSQSVGGDQAAEVLGIHVIGRPHGKIADQEKRNRTG